MGEVRGRERRGGLLSVKQRRSNLTTLKSQSQPGSGSENPAASITTPNKFSERERNLGIALGKVEFELRASFDVGLQKHVAGV